MMALTQVDQGLLGTYAQYTGFKNRIINGGMVVNQYNDGSSFTPTNSQNIVDRFRFYGAQASKFTAGQNQGGATPPAGFVNYIGVTSSSAYSPISTDYFLLAQWIEGYNMADWNWGSNNAQTVTLSFWVRSSLTGTASVSLRNGALDRTYVATYTISSANTWEYKTITVPGDTSGTWLTTNGRGLVPSFDIGCGSNYETASPNQWQSGAYLRTAGSIKTVGTSGAIFQVTGVQIEPGSTATNFDLRSYGTEIGLCQRYYTKLGAMRYDFYIPSTTDDQFMAFPLPTIMRDTPAVTVAGQNTSITGISYSTSNTTVFNVYGTGTASGSNYWLVTNVLLNSEL